MFDRRLTAEIPAAKPSVKRAVEAAILNQGLWTICLTIRNLNGRIFNAPLPPLYLQSSVYIEEAHQF